MQLDLPDIYTPAKLILNSEHKLSDDEYFAFCQANPNVNFERTAQGEIVIVPPAGGESSYRCLDVATQLGNWARQDRRGRGFDSSAEFILPNGAALSPDASWVSCEQLDPLTKKQKRAFMPVCPEFIVEVMSPSDRLRTAQSKMEEWIANGVRLGWLIDGDAETVYVYRQDGTMEKMTGIKELAAEGPVEGFVLDLTGIWAGL